MYLIIIIGFNITCMFSCKFMSPRGLRVEPDILVSIHGLDLGFSLHFRNSNNLSYGVNYRVLDTQSSATTSPTLYFHVTGYWNISNGAPLGGKYLA